jgi:hypothetical protein
VVLADFRLGGTKIAVKSGLSYFLPLELWSVKGQISTQAAFLNEVPYELDSHLKLQNESGFANLLLPMPRKIIIYYYLSIS